MRDPASPAPSSPSSARGRCESARSQGVVFDLDGVLLDTEPLYTAATQYVLTPYGKTFTWALKSQIMGKSSRAAAERVVAELALPLSVESFLAQRAAKLQELLPDALPVPGACSFVAQLQERGIPIAVATSSSRSLCRVKLKAHPWLRELEPFLCGDDPEVGSAKPAPDIYLAAAQRLGLAPADCLAIEDSPSGVQAALAAGMRVVALVAPELDRTFVQGAHTIVDSYAELSLEGLNLCQR